MAEEWKYTWDIKLLRAAWCTFEDSARKGDGWRKGNLPVWFRLSRADEGKQRGGEE